EEQHRRFLQLVPPFEKVMTDNGLILVKYWLEVSKEEQARRFEARVNDPLRQWKLSPMDIESWNRWDDYTKARDEMLKATDTSHAPWYIIRSDSKKAARLNCISHLLSVVPFENVPHDKVKLPKRSKHDRYDSESGLRGRRFVPERY
ncbi:MAG: polyphosphate kinase 2, partial [Alphaproteobacteria bacterium]